MTVKSGYLRRRDAYNFKARPEKAAWDYENAVGGCGRGSFRTYGQLRADAALRADVRSDDDCLDLRLRPRIPFGHLDARHVEKRRCRDHRKTWKDFTRAGRQWQAGKGGGDPGSAP